MNRILQLLPTDICFCIIVISLHNGCFFFLSAYHYFASHGNLMSNDCLFSMMGKWKEECESDCMSYLKRVVLLVPLNLTRTPQIFNIIPLLLK
jgi:hypothetical protein